jgi:Tol biopolymer transport system component
MGIHSFDWSPSGTFLIVGEALPAFPLLIGDLETGNMTPLLVDQEEVTVAQPVISPSGEFVVFGDYDLRKKRIVRLGDPPQEESVLPFGGGSVDWSPDERSLLILQIDRERLQVGVFDIQAEDYQLIYEVPRSNLVDGEVAWSPDGEHIALTTTRGSRDERRYDTDVFLLAPGDNNPVLVASLPEVQTSPPRWSPDGKYLAFAAIPETDPTGGSITFLDVSSARIETVPEAYGAREVDWSPDGTQIAVLMWREGIYLFEIESLRTELQ